MTTTHDPPIWLRILEKFGLPTLFALLLMGFIFWKETNDRTDRKLQQDAFIQTLQKNTVVLETLNTKVDMLSLQIGASMSRQNRATQ
jgi:hypothetical protein